MSKWLREPLLHFLLLGGLIFAVYSWVGDNRNDPDLIRISVGQQENLINTFNRTWQRPPTPVEFKGLLDDFVRQEIAYREGQALSMDDNDIVIRRRIRQKLELLAEDVAALAAPTTEDLQAYLDQHPEDFQMQPVLSLQHIYFSRDRRGESAEADARELLQRIATDGPDGQAEQFGDPLPLPYRLEDMREDEVARMLGTRFTEALEGQETGRWFGPVESGFGLHLVFIIDRTDGRVPRLDEVREQVQREWFSKRRREAIDGLYQRLAEKYVVEIEPLAPEAGTAQP